MRYAMFFVYQHLHYSNPFSVGFYCQTPLGVSYYVTSAVLPALSQRNYNLARQPYVLIIFRVLSYCHDVFALSTIIYQYLCFFHILLEYAFKTINKSVQMTVLPFTRLPEYRITLSGLNCNSNHILCLHILNY